MAAAADEQLEEFLAHRNKKRTRTDGPRPLSGYLTDFYRRYMVDTDGVTPLSQAKQEDRLLMAIQSVQPAPMANVLLWDEKGKPAPTSHRAFCRKHLMKDRALQRPEWTPPPLADGPSREARRRAGNDAAADRAAADTVIVGLADGMYPVYLWRCSDAPITSANFWDARTAVERRAILRVVPFHGVLARLHRNKPLRANMPDFATYTRQEQDADVRRVTTSQGEQERTLPMYDTRQIFWIAGHMNKSKKTKKPTAEAAQDEGEDDEEGEEEEGEEEEEEKAKPKPVRPTKRKAPAPAAAAATSGDDDMGGQAAYDAARQHMERRLAALQEVGALQVTQTAELALTALEPPPTWAVSSSPDQWPFAKMMPTPGGINNTARYGMQGKTWQDARDLLGNRELVEALLDKIKAAASVLVLTDEERHLLLLAAMTSADGGRYMAQALADVLGAAPLDHASVNDRLDALLCCETGTKTSADVGNALVGLLHAHAVMKAFIAKFNQ